jgi:hypothetical protein
MNIEGSIQVEKFLKGASYPMSKLEIIKQAEDHGVDEAVRQELMKLPERQYDSPRSINKALAALDRK